MCNVFASLLWYLAWEAEVMLVSVLGCSACGEELCLPLLLWCLAWEADVTLASVLGCLECGEELCLTLRASVFARRCRRIYYEQYKSRYRLWAVSMDRPRELMN